MTALACLLALTALYLALVHATPARRWSLRLAQARDDRRYAGGRVVAMRRRRAMKEG